jgi:hypothetical protein
MSLNILLAPVQIAFLLKYGDTLGSGLWDASDYQCKNKLEPTHLDVVL